VNIERIWHRRRYKNYPACHSEAGWTGEKPQSSHCATPGFPVEIDGVDQGHAVSFNGNRIRGSGECGEVGNPGRPSVLNLTGDFCLLGNHNCSRHAPVIKENGFESILVIAGVHQDQKSL
jgi:hypothetical protein